MNDLHHSGLAKQYSVMSLPQVKRGRGKSRTMSDQTIQKTLEDTRLTRREIEVLALIVEGHSSKEVADILFISKRTVDFHLDNVYGKLGVTNRMQALQRATRLGLFQQAA